MDTYRVVVVEPDKPIVRATWRRRFKRGLWWRALADRVRWNWIFQDRPVRDMGEKW